MEVRSDRTYLFRQPPEEIWAAIDSVDSYRTWWPWLRRFDAGGLEEGDHWSCTIRPPLPYVLRFEVALESVERPCRIEATVHGDLAGEATVSLDETSNGCSVRLTSTLAPSRQPLRGIMRMTPWLARYGHDWVLDTGLRQFRRRAL